MDLQGNCRAKLSYFRIKELKDVLTQLGLAKQGKKQDLVDRILQLLSDDQAPKSQFWGKRNSIGKEGVAKIIDDTYRKLQRPGATDLASKSHSSSDHNNVKAIEDVDDAIQLEMKVRCPCGSSMVTDSMIKCEDPRCGVWQHITCVIIQEKPSEDALPEIPPHFYCEVCRINRADPFWVTLGHHLLPTKLASSAIINDSTNTVKSVEKTFLLSRADRETLQKVGYDLQVWCLLLNDKVPFRMQWPLHTDLQVNGTTVRAVTRPGSQSLGINGRDDGPVITTYVREGINKICLSRCDTRIFCFGVRLAKRRSLQQILSLIPKEADGEHFEDALARVRRCIGGGDMENADSDSDLEVVADSVTVNLRCPMSGSRIRIAGRFKPCVHIRCFDLETFVELNQRSRKWQCPTCLKNFSLEHVIIDPYFNPITSMLRKCGEDITEIEVKPDGSWRAKNENEYKDLAKWHLPDGSHCPATDADVEPDLTKLKQIKQEGSTEGNKDLKLGIKRNPNGGWEVSKFEDMKLHPGNHVAKFEDHYQNIMPINNSTTGSSSENPIVSQEVGMNFDLSLNNNCELDSLSFNADTTYNIENRTPAPLKDPDLIVLSDSDEDNLTLVSPDTIYDTHPPGDNVLHFPSHPGDADDDVGANGLDLFSNNSDDFVMSHLWPSQTCPQTEPGFQFLGTEACIPDGLIDSRGSLEPAPINGFGLTSHGGLDDVSHVQALSTHHSTADIRGSLVDNPLAFASDDPSLQIFLPSRPGGSIQDDLIDNTEVTNGINSDDWTCLSLSAGGRLNESTPTNGHGSKQQFPSNKNRSAPLDESATLHLSINDTRTNNVNSNNRRLDTSFSHPRQPRSVRPRLLLSIDTDSD